MEPDEEEEGVVKVFLTADVSAPMMPAPFSGWGWLEMPAYLEVPAGGGGLRYNTRTQ